VGRSRGFFLLVKKEKTMNGLYLAASGAASQLAALDLTTINLANSSVPGYRRFVQVMRSVRGNGSPYQFASVGIAARVDAAQGPIYATGNPLDIAITGPAFIAVQTPSGPAYTRNGQLQRSADGTLLAAGQPVLGSDDAAISLPAGTTTIGGDGSISVDGLPVAQIQLGDATGMAMLPAGASLYKSQDGNPLPAPLTLNNLVRQGFLEGAAGGTIGGMVSMTGIMRNYEAAMRAIQAMDDDQNRAIQAFTLSA
jgi:flagellar basal-body rod protein FlgF